MPVFVTYAARRNTDGRAPLIEMEADGQLLAPHQTVKGYMWYAPELAVDHERWVDLAWCDASSGRVEIIPDDDSDNCLFWRLTDGVVQIRAYGTIIQLDVSHLHQPDSPSGSGERGEE